MRALKRPPRFFYWQFDFMRDAESLFEDFGFRAYAMDGRLRDEKFPFDITAACPAPARFAPTVES